MTVSCTPLVLRLAQQVAGTPTLNTRPVTATISLVETVVSTAGLVPTPTQPETTGSTSTSAITFESSASI